MQSLPPDIYSVIFSHIHEEKDIANVRLVSKRWQEYSRRYIKWIQSPTSNTINKQIPATMKGYRPSILKFLPNLQCPLHLILPQIEDIATISFSHFFPDLNVHIDAPKGNADEYWRLFLYYCFDLIARLRENSRRSSVIIRCCYPHQNKYRGLYYFRYDTGTIDFDCADYIVVDALVMNQPQITDADLPMQGGPVGSPRLPKDLGFSYIAPYINRMGPWILDYLPLLKSAPSVYPNITEISMPHWSWNIIRTYFDMLVSESCYITTISYYREQKFRLERMIHKLNEVWHQIPSGGMNKQVSLILPFHEDFLHNVISKFPSCRHIGIYIDSTNTSFQPEIVVSRIRCYYGIQQITFYVPSCDISKNPVIPDVSYFRYKQD